VTETTKYAVVTGAAGGIGQALVHAFHDAGYRVLATDRLPAPADLPCALYLEVDLERTVEEPSYAADVFARVRDRLDGGRLHALVNNAALQVLGGAESLTRSDWRATLNVNLLAPFVWTQALLPALEAAQGCVVNVSSIHARLTKKNFVAYATSKAALSGMTRALAVDVGGRVRVNAIEPAAIQTDMLRKGFADKPDLYSQITSCHPQHRIGQPEEIARLAIAITSGGMDFLHGACVGIDGGISGRLFDPD
jgi:NAD(P)-dependent dehydrogenase (short-subunit alcohol dehydrogenase family)